MITTVTTVTTVTTIAALGLTAAVSIAAVALLAIFLTNRELAGARSSGRYVRIARFVGIGILPLLMAFVAIVAIKIVEVLA